MKKEAIDMKRSLNFLNIVGFAGFLMCIVGTLLYKFVAVNNLKKTVEFEKENSITA